MHTLGIIPARGGSKGVPRKNIAPLGGKPLIAWTIAAARASCLPRVIVASDDPEIADIAQQHGAEVPFLLPAELAGDSANVIRMLQYVLRTLVGAPDFAAVMLLQPTSPMRLPSDIDRAVEMLSADPTSSSVISVVRVSEHPARMKLLQEGRLIDPPFAESEENQPRQQLTPLYVRNGAIYLTLREVLLGGSLKGSRCLAQVMPRDRSVNIDGPFDLELASWLMSRPGWQR